MKQTNFLKKNAGIEAESFQQSFHGNSILSESDLDRIRDEARISAAEIVCTNSCEYDPLCESLFDKMISERMLELQHASQLTESTLNTRAAFSTPQGVAAKAEQERFARRVELARKKFSTSGS